MDGNGPFIDDLIWFIYLLNMAIFKIYVQLPRHINAGFSISISMSINSNQPESEFSSVIVPRKCSSKSNGLSLNQLSLFRKTRFTSSNINLCSMPIAKSNHINLPFHPYWLIAFSKPSQNSCYFTSMFQPDAWLILSWWQVFRNSAVKVSVSTCGGCLGHGLFGRNPIWGPLNWVRWLQILSRMWPQCKLMNWFHWIKILKSSSSKNAWIPKIVTGSRTNHHITGLV